MSKQYIPVGIYKNEVFIVELEDGKARVGIDKVPIFDVLRPVSAEQLESYRDPNQREDEYKDFWRESVAAGRTEDGFDDWFEDVWSEEFDEDDEEDFPGRDDSYTEHLVDDLREEADEFLATRGIDVASYTCGGSYPPTMDTYHRDTDSWYSDFKKWDYVFKSPEAQKIAADFVKKHRK